MQQHNDELWRVQLGTGEIRTMTVDALDEAFDDGLIDAHAPVLAPGSANWTTLAEAAGLEEAPSAEETPSLSPFAVSSAPSSATALDAREPHLAPAAHDGDLDLDELALRPRRSRGLVLGGIVSAVAVAALALTVGKLGGAAVGAGFEATTAVQAPIAAMPLPALAPKEESKPAPADEAKPAEQAKLVAQAKPAEEQKLTEEQKKRLLQADKSREERVRAKSPAVDRPAAAPKPSNKAPKPSGPFLNGGDKYDPLNGAL